MPQIAQDKAVGAVEVRHAAVGAVIKLVAEGNTRIADVARAGVPTRGIIDRLGIGVRGEQLQVVVKM